ncbi:hypothetical protein ACTMTI_24470 [Nonomuraea sp. H19]
MPDRLGLFVVGRLAHRNGAEVTLVPSAVQRDRRAPARGADPRESVGY